MKILSFDTEICDVLDLRPGEDIDRYAPLHVAVASTAVHGGEERLWYSVGKRGKPLLNMRPDKAGELLGYLERMQRRGYMICSWNGLNSTSGGWGTPPRTSTLPPGLRSKATT